MAYVNKINVQGTEYDVEDSRIPDGTDINVKPIYYHGINLYKETSTTFLSNIHGTILNNSNEAIDTVAKFKQWIESIPGMVIFNCHGVITYNGVARDVLSIFKTYDGESNPVYGLSLADYETQDHAYDNIVNVDLDDYFTACSDAKNKIN